MDLIRNNIHMNKTKGKSILSITVDEDIVIPEGKGGIEHKIKDMGEVCIEKIRPMEDRVNVGGCLYFGMLYQCNGSCQSYYGKIPFEDTFSMAGINSQDIVSGKASLYDMKISIISSHKISVRAVISFVLVAESICEKEAICNIEMKNIQCRRKENNFLRMISSKKETFRIRESVNLEKDMPNIDEIMWHDMHIENMEMKPSESSLLVSGNLVIFAIYKAEENSIYCTEKIPFSGNIDISDGKSQDIYDINIISMEKSLISRTDSNGENRIIDGELILTMDIHGYREENINILYDIYAPMWQMNPQKETVEFEAFVNNNRNECKTEEVFSTPISGKIIYTTGTGVVEDILIEERGVNIMGVLTADVFVEEAGEDNSVTVIRRDIPFSKKIEIEGLDETCNVNVDIQNIHMETKKTGQTETTVTCIYDLIIFVKKTIKEDLITNVECKEVPKEYFKSLPGITGYIVKEGDNLWDIAKRYSTTVDEIMETNRLESDVIYPGMKLLIVKLYCF